MDRIKESFDSLPIAACFFDKNGVVRLINRRMLAIANWLRKGGIQSLAEMQSALHAPPANVCCLDLRLRIYRFPDGKALRFAQEQITTKAGGPLYADHCRRRYGADPEAEPAESGKREAGGGE